MIYNTNIEIQCLVSVQIATEIYFLETGLEFSKQVLIYWPEVPPAKFLLRISAKILSKILPTYPKKHVFATFATKRCIIATLFHQLKAGHALSVAYDRKIAGAAEACSQAGIALIPLAVGSLGGWLPVAVEEVKRMAKALARPAGTREKRMRGRKRGSYSSFWDCLSRRATQPSSTTGCQITEILDICSLNAFP